MARYQKDLKLDKDEGFVSFMLNDYLKKNQFTPFDYKGEQVYRAGDPMVEGYKYMKWSYENGTLHVEAWMKGLFKEMGLDGFVGCLQKKPFKESLEQLYSLLQQDIQIPEGAQSGDGPTAVGVTTVDNTGAATMALVMGILSVVLALFMPLLGVLFAVLGFNRARLGMGSSKAGLAKAGKILSIIGLVAALVLWLLNIILM